MSDDVPDREDLLRAGELITKLPLVGASTLDLSERLSRLWDDGLSPGESTGWLAVDKHYTVVPGQMTIVTGWPGSGKSEWLDALLLNLGRKGWRFVIFSPENHPIELHASKFIEKFVGKPFGAGPTSRLSKDEAIEAATEMEDWFAFLTPTFDAPKTTFGVEEILGAAEGHLRLHGLWKRSIKKGLVIDPWNELEHLRPHQLSETEYISQALSRIRGWARQHGIHVWIVAHPQKLRRDEDGKLPVPRPDMISGSQHWWNKADACITVWRDLGENPTPEVQVHIQKVRFKHVGRPGLVELNYDRITGRYHQPLRSVARDAQ